ncbi:flagellar protein FlaG [Halomonas sp. CnH100-B]|jgi:flagellar protein FlaG|uniref:flagellar protein FlaG n=1 Tax=Halomonas sp. CnH100-B TaxID=2954490 RepID=UPI000C3AFDC6|nr:flagellar protein FlaG [Halomonas sp. CnH100-B]MAO61838.1 flagellar protein [Halomonas sp.]MCO7230766.1 flagellar protein FlaG [Halomonas sp. CnH100-B]
MGPLIIDSTTPPVVAALPQERSRIDTHSAKITAVTEAPSDAEQTTKDALVEPLQRINDVMRPRGLEFDISEHSSRIITRVIDRETGDVIRQIPAEEILQMAERLEELQGKLISLQA